MTSSSDTAIVKIKRVNMQQLILDEIKKSRGYGLTLSDLSEIFKKPLNELSGRVSELYKKGKIKIASTRPSPRSKKSMSVWVINDLGMD